MVKTCIFISMKQFPTYQLALIIVLAIVKPVAGFARETGKEKDIFPPGIHSMRPVADSAAPQPKPGETQQGTTIPEIIKEVPKSRRQVKPLPIPGPIPVKPIRVIKPKLIRPKLGLTL